MEFSILMSVYYKETPKYLNDCLESVLINQSIKPNEVVVVKDGSLTEGLELVIDKYLKEYPDIVTVLGLEENKGLGKALEYGLKQCKYDLVARMDTDDICEYNRFEKQLKAFKENPTMDLIGSYITEFFEDPNTVEFTKKVPLSHEGIKKMMKKRNPLNHMTVMYRKKAVMSSGNYKHLPFVEDYYLWARMMVNGCQFMNIGDSLVNVRTGQGMFKRRSNPQYIKSWNEMQKFMLKKKMITAYEYIVNMIFIISFINIPSSFKKVIYEKVLRT